ncbi:hypothetical protein SLEP1_g14103 [Rubroshorea leprosula]|uniref:Pentatricopeptide repeat-containing protein n=1 Tax=Rubroshorea leprosula TaxID=152421 RepID=A0AAV5INZ9_9ROSI|nr:hypothetical protein SLEP1_g14103 [Rubroshorea leprosula]
MAAMAVAPIEILILTLDEKNGLVQLPVDVLMFYHMNFEKKRLLLPTCKGRLVSKFLASLQAHSALFSAAANAIEISSNEFENMNKDIDFDLLFEHCTQLHQAKCLHALLVVSISNKNVYTWNSMSLVLKLGFEWDVFVAASLIHLYTRFGLVGFARKLFDDMPARDTGSWNAMISGCCQSGNAAEALDVLYDMRVEGVRMDPVTVASILSVCAQSVCAQSNDILNGMLIHLYTIKHGLEFDLFVCNALINMYAKFGNLGHAERVFNDMVVKDVVSWNSIIAAYEQNDDPIIALGLFNKMRLTGTHPDLLTLVSLSSIVAQLNDSQNSKAVHGFITRRDWISQDVILGNAVVDMYVKLGAIDYARVVFDGLLVKDAISWNTMITGYAQNGLASEAIEVYQMMQSNGIIPNQGTWVSILPAYSHLGALQQGLKVHGQEFKNSLYLDVFVGTCLIDMYGKCGRLGDAMSLFYEVSRKSSVPWNSIISCHGIPGHGKKSVKLFREMLDEGVKPNHITFVSLLSTCSHSGLIDEGQWCFHVM